EREGAGQTEKGCREHGPRSLPPSSVSECEEGKEEEHGLRVHRREEERGRKEQEEDDGPPPVLLAETLDPFTQEKRHRQEEKAVRDEKPGVESVHREGLVEHLRGHRVEREKSVRRGLPARRRRPVAPLDDREIPAGIELRVERSAQLDRDLPPELVRHRQVLARHDPPGPQRQDPCRAEKKQAWRPEVPAQESDKFLKRFHLPEG